jgi:uncharacterized tellurite resistance protein B-like protein
MSGPLTYASIAPLLNNERREGRTIIVSFKCPVSEFAVSSKARMRETFSDQVAAHGRRAAAQVVHIHLADYVARSMGRGFAGNMGKMAVREGARQSRAFTRDQVFDDADRQRAIIEAFKMVSHHFRWDGRRWISAAELSAHTPPRPAARPAPAEPVEPPRVPSPRVTRAAPTPAAAQPVLTAEVSAFSAVIDAASFDDPIDREVLSHMIAEIAAADGDVSEDERALYEAFADAGLPISQVDTDAPVSEATLAEIDPPDAEAMMLLTLAVAYADANLHMGEAGRIETYRDGLGISTARQGELDQLAREHVVSELYRAAWATGRMDMRARNEARRAGSRLGLSDNKLSDLDKAARSAMT